MTLDLTQIDRVSSDHLKQRSRMQTTDHRFERGTDENLCRHCGLGPSTNRHTEEKDDA